MHWSFLQVKVSITDSLTASAQWCQFDDNHRREHGFRLPADPYWLAPPQGSIIPLWHRGGAPNYQPKPLICRHVQDPVKAWRRERRQNSFDTASVRSAHITRWISEPTNRRILPLPLSSTTVRIHYCSSGITAAKLASKLHSRLVLHAKNTSSDYRIIPAQTLNELNLSTVRAEDVLLLIVSSTGRGEIPLNGVKFVVQCQESGTATKARLALFGNGDSSYGDTFNAAASIIAESVTAIGARPVAGGLFQGDTACENPPWTAFDDWWSRIQLVLSGQDNRPAHLEELTIPRESVQPMFWNFAQATLVCKSEKTDGVVRVTLNVGNRTYQEMDHIKLLPPNRPEEVLGLITALAVCPEHRLPFAADLDIFSYLRDFVNLGLPFKSLPWLSKIPALLLPTPTSLSSMPVPEVLEVLSRGGPIPGIDITEICRSMPLLTPRTFSIASSASHLHPQSTGAPSESLVDLLVKIQPHGRFSTEFLSQAEPGETMRYMISASPAWPVLCSSVAGPIVAVATGSGLAPLRGLLQMRIAAAKASTGDSSRGFAESPISLFIGHKAADVDIVDEALGDARQFADVDIVATVASNPEGVRIQDKLLEHGIVGKVVEKLRHPDCRVFVYANPVAAEATALNLSSLLGADVKTVLGYRYVEEVYGRPAGVPA